MASIKISLSPSSFVGHGDTAPSERALHGTLMMIKSLVQKSYPDDYVQVYYSDFGGTLVSCFPADVEEYLADAPEDEEDEDIEYPDPIEVREIIDSCLLQMATSDDRELSQLLDQEIEKRHGPGGIPPKQ